MVMSAQTYSELTATCVSEFKQTHHKGCETFSATLCSLLTYYQTGRHECSLFKVLEEMSQAAEHDLGRHVNENTWRKYAYKKVLALLKMLLHQNAQTSKPCCAASLVSPEASGDKNTLRTFTLDFTGCSIYIPAAEEAADSGRH